MTLTKQERQEGLREALIDSVKHHLIADVPVGIFLSAGMDSTTLVALASEIDKKNRVNTVTLGFREYIDTHDDETPLAALAADRYSASHRTIWVSKDDFHDNLDQMLNDMDQPSIDGVNSYFVCMAAKKAGLKVALSGLGGDELFGSYPSFRQVPKIARLFRPFSGMTGFGRGLRAISAPVLRHFTSPKYAGMLEYGGSYSGAYLLRRGLFMPWELPEVLDREMMKQGLDELRTLTRLDESISDIENAHLRVSALELQWYMRNQLLRDMDWASMAHSLEVRVPLVDINLLRALGPLLSSGDPPDKRDLASSPKEPLPAEIMNRGKTGFSVPTREWIAKEQDIFKERGLRGWARHIYGQMDSSDPAHRRKAVPEKHRLPSNMEKGVSTAGDNTLNKNGLRILALVPDAFGGYGGIALYNRDLLKALSVYPGCWEVVAIPRLMPFEPEAIPERLTYVTDGLDNKVKYSVTVLNTIRKNGEFDLIICGHINLLPLAYAAKRLLGVPLILEIYGIEVWSPTESPVNNYLLNKIDAFISISDFTRQKFLSWAKLNGSRGFLLPNAIHASLYGPGPKNPSLLERYGLHGKTVIMTLGRLVSFERYKGFDEVMEVMPELIREAPDLAYMIVGDGSDRKRLEEKADALGLSERVIFTGLIHEDEKADHYRLADAYIMPGRGEGFGFVFLEAMACGIPVVASKADGSREAARQGSLGMLVEPGNGDELIDAALKALKEPKGVVPDGLSYFSFDNFKIRLSEIIDQVL